MQLGARLYDPAIGRFLSRDAMFDPANLNAYAFAGNDPVNNADPRGACIVGDQFRVKENAQLKRSIMTGSQP